jgi:tellurite resistance protein TehA-like permease
MPDIIRRTKAGRPSEVCSGLLAPVAAVFVSDTAAHAEGTITLGRDLVENFASIESHEIAALALILGVILFAVVTSIMLVRTRTRAAEFGVAARDEIATLEADVERLSG